MSLPTWNFAKLINTCSSVVRVSIKSMTKPVARTYESFANIVESRAFSASIVTMKVYS